MSLKLALHISENPRLSVLSLPSVARQRPVSGPFQAFREKHEAGRHEIRAVEGGHESRNPGLGWRTVWDGQGFLAQPASAADGAWQWGLALSSYGFAGAEQTVSGKPTVPTDGQRLSYQWDANMQEWYVNEQSISPQTPGSSSKAAPFF